MASSPESGLTAISVLDRGCRSIAGVGRIEAEKLLTECAGDRHQADLDAVDLLVQAAGDDRIYSLALQRAQQRLEFGSSPGSSLEDAVCP